ncbi:hypothetical protein [Marinobacterium rhizophilum]|uniref:Uncharacterized protein n=1 Tax=Marinobacterium rhizophilum TaxID=420402 RepID=A0ABY5HKG2_9GAMM|nr:hypothetical protein [Marinobacterium rhizophilum]UTW12788.1 hypothetical protein KDW95_03675 [Marinobacterium rhizophilum]
MITTKAFRRRMAFHLFAALALVVISLGAGVAGHMYFENMPPVTALVASITLTSGLGLSIIPQTTSGQLFVSLYGIFSGYVYIATSTIVIAPMLHRLLHRFHLDE